MGNLCIFSREKGNNITCSMVLSLFLEERVGDSVYAPLLGFFIKTSWPIIFINQPVSLPTMTSSARQHIHEFMNVHTNKGKKCSSYWNCCCFLEHIFTRQTDKEQFEKKKKKWKSNLTNCYDIQMFILLINVSSNCLCIGEISLSESRFISRGIFHEIRILHKFNYV